MLFAKKRWCSLPPEKRISSNKSEALHQLRFSQIHHQMFWNTCGFPVVVDVFVLFPLCLVQLEVWGGRKAWIVLAIIISLFYNQLKTINHLPLIVWGGYIFITSPHFLKFNVISRCSYVFFFVMKLNSTRWRNNSTHWHLSTWPSQQWSKLIRCVLLETHTESVFFLDFSWATSPKES